MRKIFIIGNSSAAVKSAELIRQQDQESEITLVSTDGHFPYEADRLSGFVSGQISQKELLIFSKDFYEKNKIMVILDKTISKINLKRSRIFTEQKDQWEYDVLIIADLPGKKFPDIKGSNKEGNYYFRSLPQVDLLSKKSLLIESVAIRADSFEGFEFACTLKRKVKEVFLFVSENSFVVQKLSPENKQILFESLSRKGMFVIQNNDIAEILGDSDVKAIRLKSGKVLAAQMVVFEDMREDWRIFSENELQVSDRFEVDEFCETSVKNVYAFSPIAKSRSLEVNSSYVVSTANQWLEAKAAATKIIGKEISLGDFNPLKTLILDEIAFDSSGGFKENVSQQLVSGQI